MSGRPSPLLLLACALLVACSSPRKAQERACHRAEKIMQRATVRAAFRCPTSIDRPTMTIGPDTVSIEPELADSVDLQQMLDDCEKLYHSTSNERDLFKTLLKLDREELPVIPEKAAKVSVRDLPTATRSAVMGLRTTTCQWEPVHYEFGSIEVDIRPGEHAPLVTFTQNERTVECPPAVAKNPCPPSAGVGAFYQAAAIIEFILLLILGALWYFTRRKPHSDARNNAV